jgi:hypothetical protein
MATNVLWRIATRLLRPSPAPAGIHLELMSNEDLDHWAQRPSPGLTKEVSPNPR